MSNQPSETNYLKPRFLSSDEVASLEQAANDAKTPLWMALRIRALLAGSRLEDIALLHGAGILTFTEEFTMNNDDPRQGSCNLSSNEVERVAKATEGAWPTSVPSNPWAPSAHTFRFSVDCSGKKMSVIEDCILPELLPLPDKYVEQVRRHRRKNSEINDLLRHRGASDDLSHPAGRKCFADRNR